MFRLGNKTSQYIKIWKVEDKGNWSNVQLGSSKKDKKNEGEYINSNAFGAFFGDAHKKASQLKEGDMIEITDGGIEFPYNKEHKKTFINITVNDFEIMDSGNTQSTTSTKPKTTVTTDDDFDDSEIPF